MFDKAGLLDLHNRVHQSYAAVLDHLADQPSELLKKPVEGFGFPTLREQLSHIAGAELFWVAKLQQEEADGWEDESLGSVNDLRRIFMRVAVETREYVKELNESQLTAHHELVFPDGSFKSTIGLVVAHIVTHGFHHKGQIAAMCRVLGCPMDDTDLVIGVK